MTALTAMQRNLLDFIKYHQGLYRVTPSFDEMREGLGLRSKSGIHRLVAGLEERGYIRRLANRARAIEVLPDPHLPDVAVLSALTVVDLAREAKRRGLALGHYHRTKFRVGENVKFGRTFVEIAA
jgi:repressor LexA